MNAPGRSIRLILGFALSVYTSTTLWGAIGPGNVLVLYNTASPEGLEVANYYAQAHPGVHLLGLTGLTTAEQITDDVYLNVIRPQILPALSASIDTIVTTKGMPLRIYVDDPNPGNGYVYTDPNGIVHTIWSWKPYSSLESELTRIDLVSNYLQMGDQTWYAQPPTNPSKNPYYGVTTDFNHDDPDHPAYSGMRLTARLDGFTTANVKASIDRAQQAFLISNSRWVVVDDDPNPVGQDLMGQLDSVLVTYNQAHRYETTDAAVITAPGPVIGYVSHGVNDGSGGLEPGYIAGQLNLTLAAGAVFQTHESFNAYTFTLPENQSQGLIAEWLAIGGTAGVGHVAEPSSGSNYEANEDLMFKMLLDGKTWGEAAWSSMRQLSYVNTVVGDPLMTWKLVFPGDANFDGRVNVADLSLLGKFWGTTGQAGGYIWGHGDFNADGIINVADLSLLGANWGKVSDWASGGPLAAGALDTEAFLASIPEPSISILIITGLLTLLAGCGCYRFIVFR